MSESNGKPALIPAVAYLRKSTKEEGYEKSIADQMGRIQKLKPPEEGAEYDIVRRYEDPGIPGWKRGHKRPNYFQLVNDLKERRDVKAVLVDDMDRFSRADPMETVSDVQQLRELGVRYLHAANQGVKDLYRGPVAMLAMQISMEANASHEFSSRLSRRILSACRDKAKEGKRDGEPPYGMVNDGKGGLAHGDPEHLEVVRWLFEQFANQLRSMNWLAGDLNARHVPGPRGGCWYVKTIAKLLRRPCYRGDFTYNQKPESQFYALDDKGEVIPKTEFDGTGKVFRKEGVYQPVVDPALFDKAQQRLGVLKVDRSRRKRTGHALTGVLFCGHCGLPLYATAQKRSGVRRDGTPRYSPTVYRCSYYNERGQGTCNQRSVRESAILPFVLRTLGEEIDDLKELLARPPEQLTEPRRKRDRDALRKERDKLAARIDKDEKKLLRIDDERIFKSLQKQVSALRDRLEELDAELAAPVEPGFRKQELQALADWWNKFDEEAVSMPVSTEKNMAASCGLDQDPLAEESAVLVHPLKVNDALLQLGCKIELWWETKTLRGRRGKPTPRYTLVRGRFRLGQRTGGLPRYVLEPSAWRRPSARRRRGGG
jgi:DNA invertase Pin-like site-specific DNA recombinase